MSGAATGGAGVGEAFAAAADAFVIPAFAAPPGGGPGRRASSLVLRAPGGAGAVLVDTSSAGVGPGWPDVVWSLVEPDEVRYVVLSGDRPGQVGHLAVVRAACPSAVVVGPRTHRDVEVGRRRIRLVPTPGGQAAFDESTGLLWTDDLLPTPPVPGDDTATDTAWLHELVALGPRLVGSVRAPLATGDEVLRAFRLAHRALVGAR